MTFGFFFGPQRCGSCRATVPFSQIRTRPIDDKAFTMLCVECAPDAPEPERLF